jgi:HPr kinase/phosphorylase
MICVTADDITKGCVSMPNTNLPENKFTVTLQKIIDELKLETIYLPRPAEEVLISENEVNRPGLQLMNFYEYFNPERIQILGKTEFAYLSTIGEKNRTEIIHTLFKTKIPALVITRDLDLSLFPELVSLAELEQIPVLKSKDSTSSFMAALIAFLNLNLAPRITRHGVLVEIYGEGVLILGESGVGKSETAIELVKRGHRLVADDSVEIRKVSNISLVGTSPDNIRHFLELRGIGIINARTLFGVGAVKVSEKIDLIVELEIWDKEKLYDRLGIDNEYISILGVNIPAVTIPVKPGRNLAVILEVAAMNARQKKMGYNATHELLERLGMEQSGKDIVRVLE